jgi:anti-sigma regulatory factor (Ser/Thr protein kinase)/DNA-binding NarL/FixJ family response regulator
MGKLLVIGHGHALATALATSDVLKNHQVEICAGPFEASRILRSRAVDVIVTDLTTSASEDLALVQELRQIRPGLKAIVVAPTLTSTEIISALREHVFACFTAPVEADEVAHMAKAAIEDADWRDAIQVVSGLPYWITLRVSCRLVSAERLTRFMTEYRRDLPPSERDLLMTAFREMLLNAMEHGAGFDPDKTIEVTAAQTARAIVYHFRDPGNGFNREELSHAAATPNREDVLASALERLEQGRRPGGFGMLIVRHVVDELVYNERGNEVLMIKYLS